MRKTIVTLVMGLFFPLIVMHTESVAVDIQPRYDSSVPGTQQDLINFVIAGLEGTFTGSTVFRVPIMNWPLVSVEPVPGRLYMLTPEGTPLALTDWLYPTGINACPESAIIIFNSNINWHWGLGPPPDDRYDGWSVATHELLHAIGFAYPYKNYSDSVNVSTRTFHCGVLNLTLAGSDTNGLSHLDAGVYPNDLMNLSIGPGIRRSISDSDKRIFRCAFAGCYNLRQIPTLTQWSLIILVALIVFSTWVVLRRRKVIGVR